MNKKGPKELAHERSAGVQARFDTNSGVATPGSNEAGDTKSKSPGRPDVGENGDWLPS